MQPIDLNSSKSRSISLTPDTGLSLAVYSRRPYARKKCAYLTLVFMQTTTSLLKIRVKL